MSGVEKDLTFVLKYYQGDKFVAWLRRARDTMLGSGHDLVMAISGTDNVYSAERVLRAAEAAGLIERGSYAPSVEMQFFGVGGLSGKDHAKQPESERSKTTFNWTVTDKGREFLRERDTVKV